MKKREKGTASIKDVARKAGVSIASVSRVINDNPKHVSSKTRTLVQQAIKDLNYSPNRIGRALRSQTSDSYALIISNIQNSFYAAVAWELERKLNETGTAMLLFNSNEDPKLQDRFLQDIQSRRVGGIFMLCAVESDYLKETVDAFPTVFINRPVSSMPHVSYIGIDDYAAARELTQSIFSSIEGRLGILHGPLSSDTSARRLKGVLDVCTERGYEVFQEDKYEADLSMESGYQGAFELLAKEQFGGIFCGNDQIAYGAFRRCRELGLSVPGDIRIYGFDDNPLNEWLAPWLNTVRVPHVGYAEAAVRQMHNLIETQQSKTLILPYDLVIRS